MAGTRACGHSPLLRRPRIRNPAMTRPTPLEGAGYERSPHTHIPTRHTARGGRGCTRAMKGSGEGSRDTQRPSIFAPKAGHSDCPLDLSRHPDPDHPLRVALRRTADQVDPEPAAGGAADAAADPLPPVVPDWPVVVPVPWAGLPLQRNATPSSPLHRSAVASPRAPLSPHLRGALSPRSALPRCRPHHALTIPCLASQA